MKKLCSNVIFGVWILGFGVCCAQSTQLSWIRINQLGYTPAGTKVAVWCSKQNTTIFNFELVDAVTRKIVFSGKAGKRFGAYGPFTETCRLDFSSFIKPGKYFLKTGSTQSPVFSINNNVYKGAADFCLRYIDSNGVASIHF